MADNVLDENWLLPQTGVPAYQYEEQTKPFKPSTGDQLRWAWSGPQPQIRQDHYSPVTGAETRKYDKTANFPIVKAALDLRIAGVFWAGWTFQGQNDYKTNPEFEELDELMIAELHRQSDGFTYSTLINSLKTFLRNSMVFGFGVAEKDFQRELGRGWVVKAIKNKWPFLITQFYIDPGDNLRGLFYSNSGVIKQDNELEKFVIGTYPYLQNGQYYGVSEMRAIYQDVLLAELLEEAVTRAGNATAIKPVFHYYNANESDQGEIDQVRQALANLSSASVVSIPGYLDVGESRTPTLTKRHEIEVLEDRASPDGMKQTIEMLNIVYKRITRTLGVPDDLGFTTTGVGSLAKAKEEVSMFLSRVIQDQQYLQDIVNAQIIPYMLQYNYPNMPEGYRWPKFQFETVEEDHFAKISYNLSNLKNAGMIMPNEPWVRELLNIPPAPPELMELPQNMMEPAAVPAEEPTESEEPATTAPGEQIGI